MRRILVILVLLCTTFAFAQEKTFESEVSKISRRIDKITVQQKDSLKEKVREINAQLEKGEITKDEADKLKKEAAEYHAKQIETLVSIEEKKLQLLVQNKTNGKILGEDDYYEESTFSIAGKIFQLRYTDEDFDWYKKRRKRRNRNRWSRRTTTQFVFAMGLNNTLENNKISSLDGGPYQFWRSRFYEIGVTAKYRLSKKPSKAYLKYGVSFLWNNLRPDGNQYHVVNNQGKQELQTFPMDLDESRLRHVQMIFPLHFELDFSKNSSYNDRFYDGRNNSFRIGVGGFVGFKLGTRQYLEYKNTSGAKVEEVQYGSFNTNIYNYGLSSYIAYRSLGFYVKYDLNPFFKNSDIRNISMGIRFDFD